MCHFLEGGGGAFCINIHEFVNCSRLLNWGWLIAVIGSCVCVCASVCVSVSRQASMRQWRQRRPRSWVVLLLMVLVVLVVAVQVQLSPARRSPSSRPSSKLSPQPRRHHQPYDRQHFTVHLTCLTVIVWWPYRSWPHFICTVIGRSHEELGHCGAVNHRPSSHGCDQLQHTLTW